MSRKRSSRRLALALGASLAVAACRGPTTLPGLYQQSLAEQERMRSPSELERQAANERERRAKVMEMVRAKQLSSATDHFYAAAILVSSDAREELELARDLGFRAAELGDARGRRVAAEAIDRSLLARGLPQKYGTQYVYEPVLKRWSLYLWDAQTTDEERRSMGVPTLDESIARIEELNRSRPMELKKP